jgi:prepilin-type processing-associated H-X9-DG protein
MQRRALTLIELLVIIGVIAVLAAILLPPGSFGHGSRENARKSSCQNNLKQIALGFKQYTQDYDERHPLFMVTDGSSNGAAPYGWADALQPYIRNTEINWCPADSFEETDVPTAAGYTDYFYNANFMVFYKGKWTGAPQSVLGSPAQTIMAGERGSSAGVPTGDARSNYCGDGTSVSTFGERCAPSSSGIATLPSAQIHLDGSNFAFADGHVKWLPGKSATQSAHVLNNGMMRKMVNQATKANQVTFSLLTK